MTHALVMGLLLAWAEGVEVPPEGEAPPSEAVALESSRWHALARLEATTLVLLPRAGGPEGFEQLSPTLVVDDEAEWGLYLSAAVRVRLWGGQAAAGRVRKEDWDSLSDWGQVVRALKLGSDASRVGLWVGALEDYSLASGHLVRRYSNRAHPDYHPAGAFLTASMAPLEVEAFTSDVLGARLTGAQADVDVEHLLGGLPREPGRYRVGLSAVRDWGRAEGVSPQVTLVHVDGTAVVVVRPGFELHVLSGWGERVGQVGAWGAVLGVGADAVRRTLDMKVRLVSTGCATLPAAPVWRQEASGAPGAQAFPEAASERGETRLYRRHTERMFSTDVALVSPEEEAQREAARAPPVAPPGPPSCGGQAVPEGWPDYSSWVDEDQLAPFFRCTSPGEFLALQRRVDMPRLVEALNDWSAVRLGALGPMEARAAEVLQRKRFSFLLAATRKYGAYAQVLTLFLFDTAFDDEVGELVQQLARDKQLEQTLGGMEAVREALARRGFKLSDYPEREEHLGDVLRGLGRAADDVASTIPLVDGARGDPYDMRAGVPPPYQEAFDETQAALTRAHFAPGHVVLGNLDAMTFGVPLGFYCLAAGTGRGVASLSQGHYEQATRELAPAVLMVGLYAGGKGMRSLSEAQGVASAAEGGVRLPVPELRFQVLKEGVERLREKLGEQGLGHLARYIQAQREGALLVGAGGEPAAVALYEARGDLTRAQALLSQATHEAGSPDRPVAGAGKSPSGVASMVEEAAGSNPKRQGGGGALGSVASLVDESVGHTKEVLHAKLLGAEVEFAGARLPADVAGLEQQRPVLGAPPPGVPAGSVLWGEYLAYRENRLSELKTGQEAQGPLRWEGYAQLRGRFARGLAFERSMVALLRADAALPRAQRLWLRDFNEPRLETYVGVAKEGQPGVRFADVLVIEQQPAGGQQPRVETFSFKSRDLSLLDEKAVSAHPKGPPYL
jgi:hypothetical protein